MGMGGEAQKNAIRRVAEILNRPPSEGQIMYVGAGNTGLEPGTYCYRQGRWHRAGSLPDMGKERIQ